MNARWSPPKGEAPRQKAAETDGLAVDSETAKRVRVALKMTEERLPTAVDIAAQRVRDMPTSTLTERLSKAMAYQVELRKAKEEISRGEWSSEAAPPLSGKAA